MFWSGLSKDIDFSGAMEGRVERPVYPEPASSDAGFKMPKLMRSIFSQAESSPSD